MKRSITIVFAILIVITLAFTGCVKEKNGDSSEIQTGKLDFAIVDPNSIEENNIKEWYEDNYKKEGLFSIDGDDNKYIIVGAGEKNTGGYSVDIVNVEGNENEILVDAKLNVPEKDQLVTEAITYPNVLIRINKDERTVVLNNFTVPSEEDKDNTNLLQGKGVYVGLIDNNSCEIEVDNQASAYRLEESARESIENLQNGDEVVFTYYENEHGQFIIKTINKAE